MSVGEIVLDEVERIKVSLVIPFFNEQHAIDAFYRALIRVLNDVSMYEFEIVCVDDGSSDETLRGLQALVEHDSRFIALELSRHFGKEAALTAGLDATTGAAVIVLDADLQDPPELIPQFLMEWRKGADVVLGCRADRSSDSWLKRCTAKLFYRIHNQLSDIEIPENAGDFRLMDRAVIEVLKQLPERTRFMKGLFAWVGFKTVSVNYVRAVRSVGKSKFSIWRLWNFALDGITGFSTIPLRIWTYIGSIGAVLTLIYALFIILRTLIIGVDVPGYASLLVVVLFLGCVQLVSIGMLGEYIGRIFVETKQRPSYIIRRVYQHEV